jgi:hypothetical protein
MEKNTKPDDDADTACVCCQRGVEAANELVNAMITTLGFAVTVVGCAEPPFAYSTGLTETYQLPEIVIMGRFEPETINAIFNGINALARKNADVFRCTELASVVQRGIPGGKPTDGAVGFMPLAPEHLRPDAKWPLTRTIERYGPGKFEACQFIVCDPKGRLPWHKDYDHGWGERVQQHALYAPLK